MIMINGNWEQVKDLSDIVRIVNENIGYELAQKVEEIFRNNEDKIEDLEIRISELELKKSKKVLFSERNKLAEEYKKWLLEYPEIEDCPLNVINFVDSKGLLMKKYKSESKGK